FGQDRIDYDEPIYIVEGPFDSTFIQNSVAMAGSDVDIRTLGWGNYIWVYDNEPRNREIVNRISKSIDRGDKVVIWPKNIQEKDINDMSLAGHDVQKVVESNAYHKLEATLKLNDWKRV
ncbi:MAG: DNA primase, partial [Pseudomonadota bacterium]|nr:DNA primase [Pseudomonadota bacterium]